MVASTESNPYGCFPLPPAFGCVTIYKMTHYPSDIHLAVISPLPRFIVI